MQYRHLMLSGAIALAALAGAPPAAALETVALAGTGAATGTMRIVADAFNRSQKQFTAVVRRPIGSSGSIKAVAAGALDISLSSRALSAEELAQGMKDTQWARTPLVFATRADGAIEGLSRADVADLYSGRRTSWANGTPVRLVLRPLKDSDNRIITGLLPSMGHALGLASGRPGMITAENDTDAADAIEKLPGSFGMVTLAQVLSEGRRMKMLTLDGMRADVRGTAEARYPLFKSIYLVTGPAPTPASTAFIAFAQSGPGRAILARTGHLSP